MAQGLIAIWLKIMSDRKIICTRVISTYKIFFDFGEWGLRGSAVENLGLSDVMIRVYFFSDQTMVAKTIHFESHYLKY